MLSSFAYSSTPPPECQPLPDPRHQAALPSHADKHGEPMKTPDDAAMMTERHLD
jgi:hypothetical protein